MSVTVNQAERARVRGFTRASREIQAGATAPQDDPWQFETGRELYGAITGDKNPSDEDVWLVEDAFEDGYYGAFREAGLEP